MADHEMKMCVLLTIHEIKVDICALLTMDEAMMVDEAAKVDTCAHLIMEDSILAGQAVMKLAMTEAKEATRLPGV